MDQYVLERKSGQFQITKIHLKMIVRFLISEKYMIRKN